MAARLEETSRRLTVFVRAAQRRLALAAAGRAALVGGLAAIGIAIVLRFTGIGTWPRTAAALFAGLCVMAARLLAMRRSWTPPAAALAVEVAFPGLRNQLVTALELDRHPDRASPRIRQHIVDRAGGILADGRVGRVAPARPGLIRLGAGLLALAAASVIARAPGGIVHWTTSGVAAPAANAATVSLGRVTARVVPPAYTGLPASAVIEPARIEGLAGSVVELRIESDAPAVTLETASASSTAPRDGDGGFAARLTLRESSALTIAARDASGTAIDRRLIPVVVRPDAAPRIAFDEPKADLWLPTAAERVTFAATAHDDLGLASLSLHYTKVTGSGESYEFQEGTLPFTVTRGRPTEWRGRGIPALTSLGLVEGDILVVFAQATDRRPGSEPVVSDSYIIEIGKPQAAIGSGFAVPPEEEKSALSLSALIRKTERLHAGRGRMSKAAFAEGAEGLAVEQRMVRSETLFSLGAHGHVEDEEEEAERSHEIQGGRLENRGQTEIRESVRLMTAAEKSLLAADTGGALVSQRRALVWLQRARSKQRYFLRTLPARSRIDPTRRLTGSLEEARSWRRTAGEREPHRKIEAVREVLAALAAAARSPLDGSQAVALAGRALAVNPSSSALQEAARALTAAASTQAATNDATRREALARMAAALEAETLTVPVSAAAPAVVAPSPLRGALAGASRPAGPGGTP